MGGPLDYTLLPQGAYAISAGTYEGGKGLAKGASIGGKAIASGTYTGITAITNAMTSVYSLFY